jgi:hypothetical protein
MTGPKAVSIFPGASKQRKSLTKTKATSASSPRPSLLQSAASLPRAVSSHPDKLVAPFDLLEELESNRDEYKGTEPLTLYMMPGYFKTCLDRVRSRVGDGKPGLGVTCAACITYGIKALVAHRDIVELVKMKDKLNRVDNVSAIEVEDIAMWFRMFPLWVPNATTTGGRRQNILIGEYLKMDITEVSEELGMSASSLAITAISIALCELKDILLSDHITMLSEAANGLMSRLKMRRRVAEVLIQMLEKG